MKIKKKNIIVIILLAFSFVVIKYLRTKAFYDRMNKELSIHSSALLNEFLVFLDEPPKKKSDIDKAFRRFKVNTLESNLALFEYGYNIKYDSLNNKSFIYSYGFDKNNNNLKNTPFNKFGFTAKSNDFNIKTFFRSFFYSDIIIFEINVEEYNICKIKEIKDLKNFDLLSETGEVYRVALDIDFVSEEDKRKFINVKKGIEESINRRGFVKQDYKEGKTKTVFFRYKKGKVSVVCDNNVPEELLEKYRLEIEQYFSTIDKSYFDYAVFPITFIKKTSDG